MPEPPIYGGFVTTAWYFCASACPCAIISRSCACVASTPDSSNVTCCSGVVSATKRDNSAQSYAPGCKMEPYSFASMNASSSAFIWLTALFRSMSLRPCPK